MGNQPPCKTCGQPRDKSCNKCGGSYCGCNHIVDHHEKGNCVISR